MDVSVFPASANDNAWNNVFVFVLDGMTVRILCTCSIFICVRRGQPFDPCRFNCGLLKEMKSTMTRAWEVQPTSLRNVEDIQALLRVLDVIIKAKWFVVEDEFLRTRRRSRRADDKGDLMHKPRNSQKQETLKARPSHRDAEHAMDLIRSGGWALPAAILDEVIQIFLDEEAEDEEGGEI